MNDPREILLFFSMLAGLMLAIAIGLSTSGCASQPRTFKYSWGEIVQARPRYVEQYCGVSHWDDGSPFKPGDKPVACVDGRTIIISRDHPEVLVHELAHLDGHADPERDGYEW